MLNQDKYRVVMYRLLTGMFRDSFLAALLGFKGGTACYFFYNLPRFSVDLDFDLVPRSTADDFSERVHEKIKNIITNEGLIMRDDSLKRNTMFFVVSYEDAEQNIKIEVSRRDYPNSYEIKDFYGLPMKVLVNVLDDLKAAAINVQEVENLIFDGMQTACCTLKLDAKPDDSTLKSIRQRTSEVIQAQLVTL